MKFFTPELVERFGSENDEVADAAHTAWGKVAEEYSRHYKSIEGSLPAKFRSILEQYYLHDARVFGVSLELPFLFLTMQLDAPPHEVLVFQYYVLKQPEAIKWNQGNESCPYTEWLYDEVELKTVESIVYFEHSVLLTNGLELRIPFLQFDCLVQPPPSINTWFQEKATSARKMSRPQFIFSEWSSIAGGDAPG